MRQDFLRRYNANCTLLCTAHGVCGPAIPEEQVADRKNKAEAYAMSQCKHKLELTNVAVYQANLYIQSIYKGLQSHNHPC